MEAFPRRIVRPHAGKRSRRLMYLENKNLYTEIEPLTPTSVVFEVNC